MSLTTRKVLVSALFWGLSRNAPAHGFGQRYDLALPLWLWVLGAAASIVMSFVVAAAFVRLPSSEARHPRLNLSGFKGLAWLVLPKTLVFFRTLGAGLFLLTVAAGIWGSPHPYKNLAPTLIWVVWWVGFAFACALLGNLWELINPLRALYDAATKALRLIWRGSSGRTLSYPPWLGSWPAVVFMLAFAWLELVSSSSDRPAHLATMMMIYAGITWAGMALFGGDTWMRNAELFTLVFGILARFSVTEIRVHGDPAQRRCPLASCAQLHTDCVDGYACWTTSGSSCRELNLRLPATGLIRGHPVSPSVMVLVLTLLCTVTFDGLVETPLWIDVSSRWSATLDAGGSMTAMGGADATMVLKTIALVVLPCVFLGLLWFTGWLMTWAVAGAYHEPGRADTAAGTACQFVLTLVPIAIAYHLSHYLSMLLIAGQFAIPLVSDPFGWGWDLFGTASYRVDIGIIGAGFVWYASVSAIVAGHVLAVYLAHVVALRVYRDRGAAIRSQIPMVAFMVGYTSLSLWILAQPVVG